MNALAPIEPPLSAETPPLGDSLLNFVARAMADPTIDVAKMEALIRIQREIIADDARLQFNRAMSLAQGEMQPVVKTAVNDQTRSKYATLDAIDEAIRPIYVRHGFCLSFDSEPIEGPNERIVCEVSHSLGHTKRFHLEAAPDTIGPKGTANKTPLHGLGSTVSYLRRYLTCMIFNVVVRSEDNDGNRRTAAHDGRIGEAQVQELYDLMKRGRITEGQVLAKMAPDLRSITQLPGQQFHVVRNALLSRLNVMAQRARDIQS